MGFDHSLDDRLPVRPKSAGEQRRQPASRWVAADRLHRDVSWLHVELAPKVGLGGLGLGGVREERGHHAQLGVLVLQISVPPRQACATVSSS